MKKRPMARRYSRNYRCRVSTSRNTNLLLQHAISHSCIIPRQHAGLHSHQSPDLGIAKCAPAQSRTPQANRRQGLGQ